MTSTSIPFRKQLEEALEKIGLILFSTSKNIGDETHYLIQTRHKTTKVARSGLNDYSHVPISGRSKISEADAFEKFLANLEKSDIWIKDRFKDGDGDLYEYNKEKVAFIKKEPVLVQ
jgi:hypothetical protein